MKKYWTTILAAIIATILVNILFIGIGIEENLKQKITTDSLTIEKLKLEIELKKLELRK